MAYLVRRLGPLAVLGVALACESCKHIDAHPLKAVDPEQYPEIERGCWCCGRELGA